MRAGMADVTNAKEFYQVLQRLKAIRTPVAPTLPIVWADPRQNPPTPIPLAFVRDFSGAGVDSAQRTAYNNQTPSTLDDLPVTVESGLNLTNAMIPAGADFLEPDWIYALT